MEDTPEDTPEESPEQTSDQLDPLGMIAAGYGPDVVETLELNQEAESL